jgi:chromosome segregation ATPase
VSKQAPDEAALIRAARELCEAIERVERLTDRAGEVKVSSRKRLTRAGELLDTAAQAHRDFGGKLGALIEAVGGLRDRQNRSAETLSALAQEVDGRRRECEALEQRFAALGEAAGAIGTELAEAGAIDQDAGGIERLQAALPGIRVRLADALDQAASLTADAHAADFGDLEKQAHAVRQQLASLLDKLGQAPAPN